MDNRAVRRPSVRLVAPAVLIAGAFHALAPVAAAAPASSAAFRPCPGSRVVLCARVTVPLDRSGAVPGTVRLLVARVKGRPRKRGVLLALAGGPGQASTPILEGFAEATRPALREHELVVFDQRGTGASGLLRCPSVERPFVRDLPAAGAACAARLGPSRAFYTTRDSIADVEAVRVALGVERMSLLGVSYGTKVALGYAAAHPDRVERLVLDSTVRAEGPDVYSRSGFAAIPGLLRDVCRGRRCRGITADPVADLAGLAARLRGAPLRGSVVVARGRRHPAVLRTSGLLAVLFGSDVDPTLLPALPAAVRSAGRGDPAPILRLVRAAAALTPGAPREFSSAVLVTALCEESAFPWSRTADPRQRRHELGAALQDMGDGPFAPFDGTASIALFAMPACYAWPTGPDAPWFPTTPAGAPTLLIAGTHDLRTPLQDARELAARMPDARVLVVLGAGHSVLSSSQTACPGRALGTFFAARPVRRACPRDRDLDIRPFPVAPLALREVPPARGLPDRPARTVNAVLATVGDGLSSIIGSALEDLFEAPERELTAGGLRAGWISLGDAGLTFHRMVYVPGVVVSGRIVLDRDGFTARLRVGGRAAAPGTLRITDAGLITGRLGGRRIRLRPAQLTASVAGPAGLRALRARVRALQRARRRAARPRLPVVGPEQLAARSDG